MKVATLYTVGLLMFAIMAHLHIVQYSSNLRMLTSAYITSRNNVFDKSNYTPRLANQIKQIWPNNTVGASLEKVYLYFEEQGSLVTDMIGSNDSITLRRKIPNATHQFGFCYIKTDNKWRLDYIEHLEWIEKKQRCKAAISSSNRE